MSEGLKKGERTVVVSAIISFFLVLIKGFAGFISGSIVLISDALDSLSDLIVMGASWFGLRIAQREPDEKFPYGYYKAESITSLIISFLIIYASIELIKRGYSRLFETVSTNNPLLAVSAAVISLITSFFLYKYLLSKGKSIDSHLLKTSAGERLTDCFKSFIVMITVGLNYYGVPYVEGIVSIIISLMVLEVGVSSAKDSVIALMDVSSSKEIEERVKEVVKKIKGVKDFSDLKLRKSGPFVFGEINIKVKKFINVDKAHRITDRIEDKINKEIKKVESFIVHVEPYLGIRQKIALPIKKDKGLNSIIMKNFGRAENFLFINIKKDKVESKYVKKNKFKDKEVRAGLNAASLVVEEEVDSVIIKELGKISFHTLRDNLINIYKTDEKIVKKTVDLFFNNELLRLKKPTRRRK